MTGKRIAKVAEPVARLTWGQVVAWRARRQGLAKQAPATEMVDIISGIYGLHAQVPSSAELTLWARTPSRRTRSRTPCGMTAPW